jgi:hypothetical protein
MRAVLYYCFVHQLTEKGSHCLTTDADWQPAKCNCYYQHDPVGWAIATTSRVNHTFQATIRQSDYA